MRHPNSYYLAATSFESSLDEQLAPIVGRLLNAGATVPDACYIDLCARDLTMLRALSSRNAGAAFVGVDRDPAYDPRTLWDIELSIESEDAVAIPFPIETPPLPGRDGCAACGSALIMDIFADPEVFGHIDRLARRAPRKVFCRPPANVPQTRFTNSVENARRIAREALPSAAPDFFAAEWYYAAACVKAMGCDGRAVLHIPSRLLNLGKCEADRKAFIEAGLIEQIIQLPEPLSQGEGMDNDALVVLSHGRRDAIELIDARGRTSAGSPSAAVLSLLDELDHLGEDGGRAPWLMRLDIAQMPRTSWSLAPFTPTRAGNPVEDATSTATIGECFIVERGVPRSAITRLPDTEAESQTTAPVNYYYLTGRALDDGACIPFDSLRQAIGADDVFNLGDLYARETAGESMGLKRLKTIDPFIPHVVITRIGTPYKVAMLEPASTEWDEQVGDYWSCWLQDSVVLPDGMICLTPIARGDATAGKPEDKRKAAGDADAANGTSGGETAAGALGDERPTGLEGRYACLPEYLLAYLSTDEGQNLLRATAHGTVPQLSVGDIRKMRIPLPPLGEQCAAADRFRARQLRYEQAADHLARALKEKRAPLL